MPNVYIFKAVAWAPEMWFILFGHVDELNRFVYFNYEHDLINLITVFSLDATEGRFSWPSNPVI